MKKIALLSLSVFVVVICGCTSASKNTFQQRLNAYIEQNFSTGYYCDTLSGHKYFFDIASTPYKNSGDYLVSFRLGGYVIMESGVLDNCGGGGGGLIVHDDGKSIGLIYKFSDFPETETRKNDLLLLPKNVLDTTYEQAKLYFLK